MPVSAWIIIGGATAIGLVYFSDRVIFQDVSRIEVSPRHYSVWWYCAGSIVGSVTVWAIVQGMPTRNAALLVSCTSLVLIQAPLDANSRLLSRQVTLWALVVTAGILSVDVIITRPRYPDISYVMQSSCVIIIYLLLHWLSPRSLGWGDVLLVVPLSISLAAIDVSQLLVWQFLASFSGAIHTAVGRLRRLSLGIPFGPHLLMTAWSVLVFASTK